MRESARLMNTSAAKECRSKVAEHGGVSRPIPVDFRRKMNELMGASVERITEIGVA
jgi:hypothetical protein